MKLNIIVWFLFEGVGGIGGDWFGLSKRSWTCFTGYKFRFRRPFTS